MPPSRPTESNHQREFGRCAVSGRQLARSELIALDSIRPTLVERIRRDHPDLTSESLVAFDEVARYRARYVEELLTQEMGELSDLERNVAASLANNAMLAENVEETYAGKRTFGETVSDHLASFGGSWRFIIAFGVVLGAWIALNASQGSGAFDPYPFILLNLVLSCLAALQAPVIMMSQRRLEEKDRLRSRNDYQVNLKAELEIRHLHEKIDHLLNRQWQRLMDIQQLQLDILQERRR